MRTRNPERFEASLPLALQAALTRQASSRGIRSEERRVGKECALRSAVRLMPRLLARRVNAACRANGNEA